MLINKHSDILRREIQRLKDKVLNATDFMTIMMLGLRAMKPADGMTFDDVSRCLTDELGESVNWHDVCNRMEPEK